jgi:hypothetical protein
VPAHWVRRASPELHIAAASQGQLFELATGAFADLVAGAADGLPDRMPLLVRATARTSLIAEFLADLLDLVETEQFTATRLERFQVDGDYLRGAVSGFTGPVALLVDGVRSSSVRYDRASKTWSATAVFFT